MQGTEETGVMGCTARGDSSAAFSSMTDRGSPPSLDGGNYESDCRSIVFLSVGMANAQLLDEGWKPIGGNLPGVQTINSKAVYVSADRSVTHVAALLAFCLPDGLSLRVRSNTNELPYKEQITYDVVLNVDSGTKHNFKFTTEDPHLLVRIDGPDAKGLIQEIADGSELVLVAKAASWEVQGTFILKGFFEVFIPALSGCL